MSNLSENENRRSERISLSLSVVVKAKQSKEVFWKEKTDLISISRSGAGFYLEKECQVGQLLSLIMPMPRHLRCYDHDKELYRVWGIIQHCSQVSGDDKAGYHVGVAFVGKKAPTSYTQNPLQSYRISGMSEDGTWKIVEAEKPFVVRRHSRYWVSIEVALSALDAEKNLISDETATTENISLTGAAVLSDLKVDIGDSVNFDCDAHNFSGLAIVRNRQYYNYELSKLHLEFIEVEFPIETVVLTHQEEILADEVDNPTIAVNAPPMEEFAEV